ncbi:MAG: type II toxin-antitoxin system HicA family toxin [Nitrospirota bacterium]
MSPKLPRLTAKQLIKKLQEHGYVLSSSEGSHRHFSHPEKPGKFTIPVHAGKIIGPGLLKAILRQARLKPEDIL